MTAYTNCYFAFFDVLGFKNLVRNKECSELLSIFNELKKPYTINRVIDSTTEIPVIPPDDIHYYIMSDSICIYISDKIEHALPILTFLCMNLQVRMLCCETPILLRGSISRGGIYEDRGILFGPALVDAYLRAEELAHTPRLVIPQRLYEETLSRFDKSMLEGLTYLDTDGFYVTKYINYFCMHNSTINYRDNVNNYINSILSESMSQSVRDKYLYLKSWIDYFNSQPEVTG